MCIRDRVFPLKQTRHVGVAKSEHPRPTNGEINFEEFQPMWSQSTIVTDRRTDGQTDRQTTCDRITALCTKVHRAVIIGALTAIRARKCWIVGGDFLRLKKIVVERVTVTQMYSVWLYYVANLFLVNAVQKLLLFNICQFNRFANLSYIFFKISYKIVLFSVLVLLNLMFSTMQRAKN